MPGEQRPPLAPWVVLAAVLAALVAFRPGAGGHFDAADSWLVIIDESRNASRSLVVSEFLERKLPKRYRFWDDDHTAEEMADSDAPEPLKRAYIDAQPESLPWLSIVSGSQTLSVPFEGINQLVEVFGD